MKKSLFLFFFTLAGMSVNCMAQNFIAPKFTKMLTVLSKNINIRQEPSTQSPKTGKNPKYLFVIDETDEWYYAACVLSNGELLSNPGYVSKKVCKVTVQNENIETILKANPECGDLEYKKRTSGTYKDFYCISGPWDNWVSFSFVGKNIAGVFMGRFIEHETDIYEHFTIFTDGQIRQLLAPKSRLDIIVPEKVERHAKVSSWEEDGLNRYVFNMDNYNGEKFEF